MTNQTVIVDTTLADVIAAGLTDGDNITINSGAIVTATAAPSVLIGQVTINDGELFLDGANATNPIVFVGEQAEEINVNGVGILRSSLGWWEAPATSDGTANQTFDVSSYFIDGIVDSDIFSGVWVETGRRINYDGGSGVAPAVGDWVFLVSDNDVHGRIEQVSGDGVTGFIVVTFLTGGISDNAAIEIHSLQDNDGPEYQKSWNALANGADVLEADVFQGFGNAFQNNINQLANMGSGIAGFCFSQPYQSNTLTFGDGTNGFIPPNGARIRIPKAHFATGTIASIGINESVYPQTATKYEVETVLGGDIFISGASYGSATCQDSLGSQFQAIFCAANQDFGINSAVGRARYENCILTSDHVFDSRSASASMPAIVDMTEGADVIDCIGVFTNDAGETTQFGGQSSNNVILTRVIQVSLQNNSEFEFFRINEATVNDLVIIGTNLTFQTSRDVEITLLKTQRNIDGQNGQNDQININTGSSNIKITGWEVLQQSTADDSKVTVSDSFDIAIRCFHFIDDKFDNNAKTPAGEEFLTTGGLCAGITIARCWQENGTPDEFALVQPATSRDVRIINCSGSYGAAIEPRGVNTSVRGLHAASGPLGATGSGLDVQVTGTTGSNTGDVFQSDTTGFLYCYSCPGSIENPITVLSGAPKFTKDGRVDAVLGDQWTIEMPYFARGHSSFTGVVTTTRNGANANIGQDFWTGVDIDFQFDTGSGFNNVWLDARTPANLTAITGTVTGVKLKFRFTANADQTDGQAIQVHTNTSINDQQSNLQPLDQSIVRFRITVLDAATAQPIENARVYILAGAGGPLAEDTLIFDQLTNASGIVEDLEYVYTGDQPVTGRVRKGSVVPFYKTGLVSGSILSAGTDIDVFLVQD